MPLFFAIIVSNAQSVEGTETKKRSCNTFAFYSMVIFAVVMYKKEKCKSEAIEKYFKEQLKARNLVFIK